MTVMLDDELADLRRANAELQQRLDRALAERDEVQAQKTAMAEVLEVINRSPGDLAPVFNAMLGKATRLCGAEFGILWTYDGERFRAAALHGVPSAYAEFLSRPIELADSAALGDIARGHRYVHVPDLATSAAHTDSPLRRATVELGGARTGLAMPQSRLPWCSCPGPEL